MLIFLPHFPVNDFPWSWFHHNFKNTICLSKSFPPLLWTDLYLISFTWFYWISPGAESSLWTASVQSHLFFFHIIAGQQSGEFVTVNLGLLLQRWSSFISLPSMTPHNLNHILVYVQFIAFPPYICRRVYEFFSPHCTLERCSWVFCILRLFSCLWCSSLLACYMHSSDLCTLYWFSQCSQRLQTYCLIDFLATNIFGNETQEKCGSFLDEHFYSGFLWLFPLKISPSLQSF